MNWKQRYASRELHLLEPGETGDWSCVGEGGSIYTKDAKTGLITKTLHPVAYEGYKTIRPGMYSDPSQMYTAIAFEGSRGPLGSGVSHLGYLVHNNITILPPYSRFHTVRNARRIVDKMIKDGAYRPHVAALMRRTLDHPIISSGENDDKLFKVFYHKDDLIDLANSSPHEVPDKIEELLTTSRFGRNVIEPAPREDISYYPIPGYSLENWGKSWFGTDPSGKESASPYNRHGGHDVEAVFKTAQEAQDYAMDPENVQKYQEQVDFKRMLG